MQNPIHQRRMFRVTLWLAVLIALVLIACQPDEEVERITPTPIQPSSTPSATLEGTPVPTLTLTPNLTPPSPTFPPTATPTLIPTDPPPTITPLPTNTPGPFEHSVRTGDDCISILYQYGHVSLDVLAEFYRLNNMENQCTLGGAGQRILVPRPTSAPIAVDAAAIALEQTPVFRNMQPIEAYTSYCVVTDDTLTSVALKNYTSLRRICELNPLPDGIDCNGCDFSQSDVGSCPRPPLLREGQCLRVPGPTPVPSQTALPDGLASVTPTPTHRAPNGVYPIPNSTVSGTVRLQWTSVGLLQAEEFYVVNLTNETTGQFFIQATRDTFVEVPPDYLPTNGAANSMVWFVTVQRRTPDGLFTPIGGRSPDYRYTWQ